MTTASRPSSSRIARAAATIASFEVLAGAGHAGDNRLLTLAMKAIRCSHQRSRMVRPERHGRDDHDDGIDDDLTALDTTPTTRRRPTRRRRHAIRPWLRLEGARGLRGRPRRLPGWLGAPWLAVRAAPARPGPLDGRLPARPAPRGDHLQRRSTTWATGCRGRAASAWRPGSSRSRPSGAILVAHVGMDRPAGYGLKLPTSFQDTHLGRIGRKAA